jgi:hypothetical protein
MKTFYEMYQIIQAKKLFEQDAAAGGDMGGSMGGNMGGGMGGDAAGGGVDFGGDNSGASAGGMKGVSGQVPADQQGTMSDMGDTGDSQLSKSVGSVGKNETKESLGEIKGLLDQVLSAAQDNNNTLDSDTVSRLKQAVNKIGELADSVEDEDEEEADSEGEEGNKPEGDAAGGDQAQGADSGMDLDMNMGGESGGAAPPAGGQQAPAAGNAQAQAPAMNFQM